MSAPVYVKGRDCETRASERSGWSVNLGVLAMVFDERDDMTYFLLSASRMVCCFSCVSETPRYSILSNRPGRSNA